MRWRSSRISSLARSQPLAGGGDIALAILGFPGEAFAHDVQRHQFRKFRQQLRLAGVPCRRFGELHDRHRITMADMAKHHAERG